MKQIKILTVACLSTFLLSSCDKSDKKEDFQDQNVVLQASSNSNEAVKPGETNCIDPIISSIKIKSTAQPAGSAVADVKLLSKTEKVYPRHTFATTITLTNGVPIETVSNMLGHSTIQQTQHYAKIVGEKVKKDMAKISNLFQ